MRENRQNKRKLVQIGVVAGTLMMVLAGCNTTSFPCLPSSPKVIAIKTSPETNAGLPIAVDLVFVTDKTAWQVISTLKARDYFVARGQLRRDFPNGYRTNSWELQPGQYVAKTTAAPCRLIGTLIFADYRSQGEHRIKLLHSEAGTLDLGADDFKWIAKMYGSTDAENLR